MGSVRAVIFDIDDTLVDHSAAMRAATVRLHGSLELSGDFDSFRIQWQAAHRRHHPRFLNGEISYAESARARAREVIDATLSDAAADEIFSRYLADYKRGWALFPDVVPCLDALNGVLLGIVSNGRADEQRDKLTHLGIEGRFACVCISEELGFAKPSPRIFEQACRGLGVAPEGALYVGDQYELDALAARAAGLRSVWLNRRNKVATDSGVTSIVSLTALGEVID